MSLRIIGSGWVTPVGRTQAEVISRVKENLPAIPTQPEGYETPVLPIDASLITDVSGLPRLRRSSVISHFAVAAALDALAGLSLREDELASLPILFLAGDGSVVYTRRFYQDIVTRGPGSGSPLLFPETVYNAPASHVAAALGLKDEALTFVGDGAAALAALDSVRALVHSREQKRCLVIAAQELDRINASAYLRWGLSRDLLPSEGAGALLLDSSVEDRGIVFTHGGYSFGSNPDALSKLTRILQSIPPKCVPHACISSMAGSNVAAVEREAIKKVFPEISFVSSGPFFGESLAASTMQQVILAHHLVACGEYGRVLVASAGYHGQVCATVLA
ncbi:hypothetical protein TSACC_22285 [Terrimicrobium sacchariphilum]|uniref:Beta-ketoacyl synthase N-terminal domain-containing protein n=1 Tax=Terrimicrobium sacchariphilum TaxID=690879 RepID=A0A146G834_TERSA|nr:hypothetical protein [Terrimicrobium sacchariphilum]GAT33865.1 hypothetical protein TSACC_22285 [Terrimicrobium sacchariphilum]